jgi:tripartite ATP-independent transporter DctP family solute receptor
MLGKNLLTAAVLAIGTCTLPLTAVADTVLRFASSQPAKGGYMGEFVKVFGDALAKKTNGNVTVKGFYSGALGSNERELAEMTKTGAVDMCNTTTTYVQGWMPAAKVFDLPYLFTDVDHYKRVVQGDIGDLLKNQVRANGVEVVGFVIAGFRSVFNNKRAVKTVDDLKSLKIRSMESPIYVEMFKRMGMLPTPMPSSELLTALQLGTVDAGENDPASVMSWGWNDVIKYYSLDKHSISVLPILMNKAKFDSFPPETQKAIREAGREAENYQINYVTKAWDDSLKQIKASGVQVNEVSDLAGFQKAVAPIIEQYTPEIGADLIKKVQALATKN